MDEDYSEFGAIPYKKGTVPNKKENDYSEFGAIPYQQKNIEQKKGFFSNPSKEEAQGYAQASEPFNEFLSGGAQGLLNIIPGLANLPIKGTNYFGGKNISEFPRFNFAPDSIPSKAGEIASFFTPGLPLKAGAALSKIPTFARSVAGNALLGGAYSPENTGLGMALGAAAPAAGKVINHLLGYTYPGIARNLVGTTQKQIAEHSERYNNLWNQAEKEGYAHVNPDLQKLSNDFSYLEKGRAPAELENLEKFILEPNMKTAQAAQIDMNRIRRGIKQIKGRKSEDEIKELATATRIEKELENSMFKNEKGELNSKLRKEYDEITNSYKNNVVSYRYHPAIEKHMQNKSLPKELFEGVRKGEFAAQKGIYHPEIKAREVINSIAHKLGIPGGAGLTAAGAAFLVNALLRNSPHL
jgi:hypothetical protein